MKKIMCAFLFAFCGVLSAFDEIALSEIQAQKMGISLKSPDFSSHSLIGPFVANLDFANRSSIKQVSPFEITIAQVFKLEGEAVKKGEIICSITADSISNLIYEYKNTRSKHDIAANNATKDKQLFEEGVISQREYQNSYLLANELALKLRDLDSTIKQIGVDTSAAGFSYPIVAQSDGILALAPSKSAQKINAFTPYIIIANDSQMLANIRIPQQNAADITRGARVFIKDSAKNAIEIGRIQSIAIAIDMLTNTLGASASAKNAALKAGSNVDVFIETPNPSGAIFVSRDTVTKFGGDYVVFAKTPNGFLPTAINIIKEVNGGYLVEGGDFSPETKLASGAIIVLKGAMSDLGFE